MAANFKKSLFSNVKNFFYKKCLFLANSARKKFSAFSKKNFFRLLKFAAKSGAVLPPGIPMLFTIQNQLQRGSKKGSKKGQKEDSSKIAMKFTFNLFSSNTLGTDYMTQEFNMTSEEASKVLSISGFVELITRLIMAGIGKFLPTSRGSYKL